MRMGFTVTVIVVPFQEGCLSNGIGNGECESMGQTVKEAAFAQLPWRFANTRRVEPCIVSTKKYNTFEFQGVHFSELGQ